MVVNATVEHSHPSHLTAPPFLIAIEHSQSGGAIKWLWWGCQISMVGLSNLYGGLWAVQPLYSPPCRKNIPTVPGLNFRHKWQFFCKKYALNPSKTYFLYSDRYSVPFMQPYVSTRVSLLENCAETITLYVFCCCYF